MPGAERFSAGQAAAAGELRHRVRVQRPFDPTVDDMPQDSHGQPVEAWADVGEVAAKVEPVAGEFVATAEQQQAQLTHRVTTRYVDGLRQNGPLWRLVHKGRVLQIVSARDFEERVRFLVLDCIEQPPTAAG